MTELATVTSVAFVGVEARPVTVQVQVASGMPAVHIVGLPDKAVSESRDRIRAALSGLGLSLPPKRITINLSPADLPKMGNHYDLPIALGLMGALGILPKLLLSDYVIVGELGLDGGLLQIQGALPAAIGAISLDKGLICPKANGVEASWAGEALKLLAPDHLLQLMNHFKGTQILSPPSPVTKGEPDDLLDLRDIRGQETGKRALEIAAAGGHNLLMNGPPGSGKSMLAQRLPSILPPLKPKEMLEVSMVHSLAGTLSDGRLSMRRPFRAPHHSATMAALIGGGSQPRPGEIALAHHGVLFLDELPEFSAQVLDALRQPLESGVAFIARANHRIHYPARIQLIAAMNPCRCGRAFEPGFACGRGQNCAARYQARISGPILDRIDLQVQMPAVRAADLLLPPSLEGSKEVAIRVKRARDIQSARFEGIKNHNKRAVNADLSGDLLDQVTRLDGDGQKLLRQAFEKFNLSARAYHKLLRVARTIADLDESEYIHRRHLAESLAYRDKALLKQAA